MRDTFTAIGLAAWVAGVLSMGAAMIKAQAAHQPVLAVLSQGGRNIVAGVDKITPVNAATLGIAAHLGLLLVFAAVFALARIPLVARHPVIFGVAYGVALYLIVPLQGQAAGSKAIIIELAIHVLCLGLPISLIMARMLPVETPKAP